MCKNSRNQEQIPYREAFFNDFSKSYLIYALLLINTYGNLTEDDATLTANKTNYCDNRKDNRKNFSSPGFARAQFRVAETDETTGGTCALQKKNKNKYLDKVTIKGI